MESHTFYKFTQASCIKFSSTDLFTLSGHLPNAHTCHMNPLIDASYQTSEIFTRATLDSHGYERPTLHRAQQTRQR